MFEEQEAAVKKGIDDAKQAVAKGVDDAKQAAVNANAKVDAEADSWYADLSAKIIKSRWTAFILGGAVGVFAFFVYL